MRENIAAVRLLVSLLIAAALTLSAAVLADPTQYRIESTDGKAFIVRDHLGRRHDFRAKRKCMDVRSGHTIMFDLGGPNFTCVSATFRDVITGSTCSVWCVQPGASSSAAHLRSRTEDHERSTSLFDLGGADAGTPRPSPWSPKLH